jgi:type IV pilus assembly protein PilA
MKNNQGFTLIELMLVVSIIGILAAIAIPNFISYRDKAFLTEGYVLFDAVKKDISEFYDHRGVFPANNTEAGLAEPSAIRGKDVASITVDNGMVIIEFDQESRAMFQKIIMTPQLPEGNPTGPIIWTREDIKWTPKEKVGLKKS